MEIIAGLAALILIWLLWQLARAKSFTRFKQQINCELKDKVIAVIVEELEQSRCDAFPNSESHIQATCLYWTQYKSRILHAALEHKIIDQQWLKETGNLRNAQHLFFIEQQHLPIPTEPISSKMMQE